MSIAVLRDLMGPGQPGTVFVRHMRRLGHHRHNGANIEIIFVAAFIACQYQEEKDLRSVTVKSIEHNLKMAFKRLLNHEYSKGLVDQALPVVIAMIDDLNAPEKPVLSDVR